MLKLSYPSWDEILASDQGLFGAFRVGQTKHLKVKQVFLRFICIPSTPLGFPAKSFVFPKGGGVENKRGSSWQTVAIGEKGCPGLFFKDTWNYEGTLGLQLSGVGLLLGILVRL